MNASGKSTILSAIQFALSGNANYHDGTRILLRDLVHGSGNVSLTFDEGVLDVGITSSATKISCPGGLTSDGGRSEWINRHMPYHVFSFMLDAHSALLGGNVSEILGGMLCPDLPLDKIKAYCGVNWDKVSSLFRKGADSFSQASIMCAGDAAETMRKEAKRELAAAKATVESLKDAKLPTDTKGNVIPISKLDDIKSSITKLQDESIALERELGATLANTSGKVTEQDLKKMKASAQQIELEMTTLSQQAQEEKEELKALQKKLRDVDNDFVNAGFHLKRAQSDLRSAQANQKTPPTTKTQCPECGSFYTEEKINSIVSGYKERIDILTKQVEEQQLMETNSAELKASISAQITLIESSIASLNEKTIEKSKQLGAARNGYIEATKQIQTKGHKSPEELQKQIRSINDRVIAGQEKATAIKKVIERDSAANNALSKEAEIETLNWAVESFKNGKLINQTIGAVLESFQERCNSWLSKTKNKMRVWFEIDGKRVNTGITKNAGKRIPIRQCSNGEIKLVEMALVLSTAIEFPDGIICIDNINDLDSYNKNLFISEVSKLKSTVIAASAWTNGPSPSQECIDDIAKKMNFQVLWIG